MDGVDQCLAERRYRIADPAAYPATLPFFHDMGLREPFEMSKTFSKLRGQRTAEYELVLHLPSPVRCELDHFDAGAGKPLLGSVGEEEQSDVARRLVLVDGSSEPHPAVDGRRINLVAERATDVVQVLSHLGFPQVFNSRSMRHSVVPGHARRLLDQRLEPAGQLPHPRFPSRHESSTSISCLRPVRPERDGDVHRLGEPRRPELRGHPEPQGRRSGCSRAAVPCNARVSHRWAASISALPKPTGGRSIRPFDSATPIIT